MFHSWCTISLSTPEGFPLDTHRGSHSCTCTAAHHSFSLLRLSLLVPDIQQLQDGRKVQVLENTEVANG